MTLILAALARGGASRSGYPLVLLHDDVTAVGK